MKAEVHLVSFCGALSHISSASVRPSPGCAMGTGGSNLERVCYTLKIHDTKTKNCPALAIVRRPDAKNEVVSHPKPVIIQQTVTQLIWEFPEDLTLKLAFAEQSYFQNATGQHPPRFDRSIHAILTNEAASKILIENTTTEGYNHYISLTAKVR